MMGRLGAGMEQIAEALGVTKEVLRDWQEEHPDFASALKEGMTEANTSVEQALFRRATGYSHQEDKVYQYRGEAVIVPSVKTYPPDVAAAKFWLTNRAGDEWRDKQNLEHEVTEELAEVMKRIRGGMSDY